MLKKKDHTIKTSNTTLPVLGSKFPSQQEYSLHQHGCPDSHPPWAMHMQPE
jgi:hypothetical protein